MCNAFGSRTEPSRRNAFGQHASSWAEDCESPLANKTTSCPSATSSSVSQEMTRSVPPYSFGGIASVKGAICAICMQILYWVDRTKALLEVQSPAFCAGCGPNDAPALRDFDLGRAKLMLPCGRSVRCSLLNEQVFRLEKEFELDHGFHRTPLVPGGLEPLQYISPGGARSAQTHPSNKTYSLCCAAQYYWGAIADMQFRINWKIRHEHLTSCRCPSSIRSLRAMCAASCSIAG
jgi:hypothetical protein